MAETVVEQIAQKIEARLNQISVANGYQLDVAGVHRPTGSGGPTITNGVIVLQEGDPTLDEENSVEGNPYRPAWIQPFHVIVYVVPSDKDQTPVQRLVNTHAADIVKAITTPLDGSAWHHFDNLAIVSSIGDMQRIVYDKNRGVDCDGAVVTVNVTYRTPENDPYTAG